VGARAIVLIGLRRSGKSTVGRALAAALQMPFTDLDTEVERLEGRSIADILVQEGEPAFRKKESEALAQVVTGAACVLATGGGTPLAEPNRRRLTAFGTVVYLRVSATALVARLADDPDPDSRPVLRGSDGIDEVRLLLAERDPSYVGFADVVVDGHGDPDEVVGRCRVALDAV
jgi:shikimate kinase